MQESSGGKDAEDKIQQPEGHTVQLSQHCMSISHLILGEGIDLAL